MRQGTVARRLVTMLTASLVLVIVSSIAITAAEHEEDHGEHGENGGAAAAFFHDYISGPIVQSRCINCHVEGGLSGHTRLVFVRASDEPDHEALNLQTFVHFLGETEEGHDHGHDHEDGLEHGPERILTKIQGVSHGGGVQVPAGTDDFHNMDRLIALLEGHGHSFVERLLEALSDEMSSVMFGLTTPADGDAVAGNAVAVSATGAPTAAVHFAHRAANDPDAEFEYLGAAANRSAALYVWNTSLDMDGDYELAAMYTEDGGDHAVSDSIRVRVDNDASAETLDIVEDEGRKSQFLHTGESYEVITADGVMVTLPAGALTRDDRIIITAIDPPDDTGEVEVVSIVEIVLASGETDFGEPVTIALSYPDHKPDGLVDGTIPPIPETELSLWFLEDAEAGDGEPILNAMVQPDDDIVVAEVMNVGRFGLFRSPMPDDAGKDTPGDGNGGCTVLPVPPDGPSDPTLMALVGLAGLYLVLSRRRLTRPAATA